MTVRVKLCGLTRPQDIEAALENGVWALGFIVEAASPRRLSLVEATHLSRPAKGIAPIIAVCVNPQNDMIDSLMATMRPDMIQLHGDESPARVRAIQAHAKRPIIKAVPIAQKSDLANLEPYDGVADYLLLDAKPPPGTLVRGGHGHRFDWEILSGLKTRSELILAGGLTAHNSPQAQATGLKKFDISSGVEQSPGIKDAVKIKAFMDSLG